MEILTRLSKSTRYVMLVLTITLMVAFFVYGQVTTPEKEDWISAAQLIDYIKWALGIYAASEVGAKATVK